MYILNVAEKPSVAKEVASVLSKGTARYRNGVSKYNGVYDFEYNLEGRNCTMVFTSVSGHVSGIEFASPYCKWYGCTPVELFDAPIKKEVSPSSEDIVKNLKREARKCSSLILWLDCDREGEAIARDVADICLEAKRSLTVRRARFSSIIPAELERAVQNLSTINEKDAAAVNTRQEMDLRFGSAFTRLQTKVLQQAYPGLSIVSYGPCQFPTLGFVVERFLKHEEFVPETFWKLACNLKVDNVVTEFSWNRHRLFDRLPCLILLEKCLDDPIATVLKVKSRRTTRRKPVPLATVELQKRASKYLRMNSKRTMEVAEALYNRGIISYPRTETDRFSSETDLMSMIRVLAANGEHAGYANSLIQGGFAQPYAGKNDDKAHPPITPTKVPAQLNADERQLYDLIVRHFLACCAKDAVGMQTDVSISIASEEFSCKGLMITERNYLDIYKFEKWNAHQIPLFEEGQSFMPNLLEMRQGQTQAPQLLTEPDLIGLMDKEGIGTDATIAQHITKIQERDYARLVDNRYFRPTDLGIALVQSYKMLNVYLSTPELRRNMEFSLKQISVGVREAEEVKREFTVIMKQHFQKMDGMKSVFVDNMKQFLDPSSVMGELDTIKSPFLRCAKCGDASMDLLCLSSKKDQRFLLCKKCNLRLNVPIGDLKPRQQFECPMCNFQVIDVEKNNAGRVSKYQFCPYCFNMKPEIMDIENWRPGAFRCFNCDYGGCFLVQERGRAAVPVQMNNNGNGAASRPSSHGHGRPSGGGSDSRSSVGHHAGSGSNQGRSRASESRSSANASARSGSASSRRKPSTSREKRKKPATNTTTKGRNTTRSSTNTTNEVRCFKCNGVGHYSTSCPSSGSTSSASTTTNLRKCYNCNGEGHFASNCPQKRNGNSNRSSSSNMQRTYSGQNRGPGLECFICKSTSHRSMDCPNQ